MKTTWEEYEETRDEKTLEMLRAEKKATTLEREAKLAKERVPRLRSEYEIWNGKALFSLKGVKREEPGISCSNCKFVKVCKWNAIAFAPESLQSLEKAKTQGKEALLDASITYNEEYQAHKNRCKEGNKK
jgi:hypothetical protein